MPGLRDRLNAAPDIDAVVSAFGTWVREQATGDQITLNGTAYTIIQIPADDALQQYGIGVENTETGVQYTLRPRVLPDEPLLELVRRGGQVDECWERDDTFVEVTSTRTPLSHFE